MERFKNETGREKRLIDLHMHSINSDGEESPQEVLRKAAEAGLSLISITDHNDFTFTECQQYKGLKIVPGIELSAEYRVPAWNETTEVHIVGIFPDGVNPADFNKILINAGEGKEKYVRAILDDLDTRGIHITLEEVLAVERKCKHIGRHDIAKVLVGKGIEPNIDAVFDHQIGNFSPYYIPSTRYLHYAPMKDIVCQIITSGGVPILAHPYGYCMNEVEIEQLVIDFKEAAMGHDFDSVNLSSDKLFTAGMEVYYQRYLDESDIKRYEFLRKLQEKYGMLASASSDRHRPYQPFCSGGDYCLFEKMVQSLHGEKFWR